MLVIKIEDYQKENRQATKWLLQYNELKQGYIEKSNIQYLGAAVNDGMPRSTDVGRPCESKGITLAGLEAARKWIISIEGVESVLGPKKLVFLQIRRQAEKQSCNPGKSAWIDYTMSHYAEWHHREYGGDYVPSYRTLQEWWKEIVDITVRLAIRNGCL